MQNAKLLSQLAANDNLRSILKKSSYLSVSGFNFYLWAPENTGQLIFKATSYFPS